MADSCAISPTALLLFPYWNRLSDPNNTNFAKPQMLWSQITNYVQYTTNNKLTGAIIILPIDWKSLGTKDRIQKRAGDDD